MSKSNNRKFVPNYNYYEQYKNELDVLLRCADTSIQIGIDLIKSHNSERVDRKILKIDNELTLISRFLWNEFATFAFRWNEFFSITLEIKNEDNSNWFWYVSNFNNISKHLDIEINEFYHGWFRPKEYFSNEELENLIEEIKNSKSNSANFIACIKKIYVFTNRIKYELNKSKGYDYLFKKFNISNYDDYLEKTEVFLPQYENYLSIYINLLAKNNKEVKATISYINNFFDSDATLNKFKKTIIDKAWYSYYLKIIHICGYLLFIEDILKKISFESIDSIKKSSFPSQLKNSWKKYLKDKPKMFKSMKFRIQTSKQFYSDEEKIIDR